MWFLGFRGNIQIMFLRCFYYFFEKFIYSCNIYWLYLSTTNCLQLSILHPMSSAQLHVLFFIVINSSESKQCFPLCLDVGSPTGLWASDCSNIPRGKWFLFLSSNWLTIANLLWVEPWALGRVSPSPMLEYWLVWSYSSCVDSYSCYKFMCLTALPCLEDSPSKLLSHSPAITFFLSSLLRYPWFWWRRLIQINYAQLSKQSYLYLALQTVMSLYNEKVRSRTSLQNKHKKIRR